LQQKLNALGIRDEFGRMLDEDGIFGKNTMYAVNAYKDIYLPGGNTGDMRGIVGNTTWDHMEIGRLIDRSNIANLVQTGSTQAYGALTAEQIARNNEIISSGIGIRPILDDNMYVSSGYPKRNDGKTDHGGFDIAGIKKGTDIYSTYYGIAYKLTQTDENTGKVTGFGQYVRVDTVINNADVSIYYGHMSEWAVKTGTLVEPGTKLGGVGMTGTADGLHLHFEVRINGVKVDPYQYALMESYRK
jgi:murein DD-endopeptidase MepM/ murein hydrolase activator NlpD